MPTVASVAPAKKLVSPVSVVKLVDEFLLLAFNEKASDIHIEPWETDCRVRIRIDGVLVSITQYQKIIHEEVVARLKVLASLRTDVRSIPQDGRFKFNIQTISVNVRISIVPSFYGEKIVLRLLPVSAKPHTLGHLGFSNSDIEKISQSLSVFHGMILVSGPTGSGKTTTLYTLLHKISSPEISVVTLEDPIEYSIPGITQIPIHAGGQMTFTNVLRATVRQDPDVLMVGEIRDSATAELSTHIALTGHLLLSTVHTNDAVTTIPRLIDIGTGVNKVDVSRYGNFAAQNSVSSQLVSLDISESNFAVTATSTLPNVAGQRPEAVSLATYNSQVYMGTKRTAGHEFHIYDAGQLPSWLGSIEMNHNINDIEVKDDFAFLATSGNIRDMIVLDIANPSRVTQATVVDLPGNEDGKTLYVAGDLIFLGRYKATAPNHLELNVLRTAFDIGGLTINLVASISTGSDINDIVYAGGFIYAATSNPQKEVQIFKLDSKSLALTPVGHFDLPVSATSIDFENNLFVVSSGEKVYVYNQHE